MAMLQSLNLVFLCAALIKYPFKISLLNSEALNTYYMGPAGEGPQIDCKSLGVCGEKEMLVYLDA